MKEELGKYFAVYGLSMFKFIFGPLVGTASELSVVEVSVLTALGMMTSVVVFCTIGKSLRHAIIRRYYSNRKLFSPKNRKRVRFWRNYGLTGVAFLTPVIFSPIGGTILATAFGESTRKIVIYMFVSSIFWSFILSFILHHAARFPFIVKLLGPAAS
jgi:hypothetical protein